MLLARGRLGRLALRLCRAADARRGRNGGGGAAARPRSRSGFQAFVAPVVWKLVFQRDVEPELLAECAYVETPAEDRAGRGAVAAGARLSALRRVAGARRAAISGFQSRRQHGRAMRTAAGRRSPRGLRLLAARSRPSDSWAWRARWLFLRDSEPDGPPIKVEIDRLSLDRRLGASPCTGAEPVTQESSPSTSSASATTIAKARCATR